jgi:hypothetical protein
MSGRPSWYRRRIVVDFGFQTFYFRLMLGMCFLFCVLLFATFRYLAPEVGGARPSVERMQQAGLVLILDGLFMILVTVGIGGYTILHTHRVAGPAYRLKNCIRDLEEGRLDQPIRIRERDYLQDLASGMESLRRLLLSKATSYQELRVSLEKMEDRARTLGDPGLTEAVSQLRAALDRSEDTSS